MSSGTATHPVRSGLWIAGGLTLLALAALVVGAWWVWGGRPTPPVPPVPPDPQLGGAPDPEVAAAFAEGRRRVLREPQSAAAWGAYGQVLLANGCTTEAAVCLAQAEKLDPAEARWPYLLGWDLISTDRPGALDALRRAADRSDHAGGLSDAAAVAPWVLLAEVYMEKDDREQVEACCRRVFEREPDNARAHFDLGMIAFMHDDLDVCIPHLLRAANSPAVRQRAYTQLAAAYQRQGNEQEATKYTQLAQQAADAPWYDAYVSDLEDLKMGREMRYHQVNDLGSQGRLREQAALLQRMANEYGDARSNLELGVVLTKLEEFDEAKKALQKAASLDPRSADPCYFLGVALYQQGEKLQAAGKAESAADLFRASAGAARKATQLKADHALAHYYLGLALEKLDRRKEAIESLGTAARCRPEMFDIQLELGKALAEDGQRAEAEAHLQQACDLAPGDARPREALARVRGGMKPE